MASAESLVNEPILSVTSKGDLAPRTPSGMPGSFSQLDQRWSSGIGKSLVSQLQDMNVDAVPLVPYVSVAAHLKAMLSPALLVVVLLCALISGLGMSFVSPESFNVDVTLPNIASLEGCIHYCNRSRTDSEFSSTLGGRGYCEDDAGKLLPKFYICHRTDEGGVERCKEVFDDHDPDPESGLYSTKCTIIVTPDKWKPYAAAAAFAIAITLIIQDGPAEVLLIGAATILCIASVITPEDVFKGLSNEGVVGLAVLFPIAEAIGESGLLEKAVGVMLGTPGRLVTAVPRLMFPVALLSSLLSNTATVAMMIPITVSWARRLGTHPGKLLMPLSFAAQLGGSCTLLGSSHVLVAKTAVPASLYDMGFFDLAPIGVIVMLISTLLVTFLANTGLLKSSLAEAGEAMQGSFGRDLYEIAARVTPYGGLTRGNLEDSGLHRLHGVADVHRGDAAVPDSALQVGELLRFNVDELGVISVRGHPGLRLENQDDLDMLGAGRQNRRLYEVTLRKAGSEDLKLFKDPERMRQEFGACVVAGPKGQSTGHVAVSGSVLLLEADRRYPGGVAAEAWTTNFGLVRQIPRSVPPRMNMPIDTCRNIVVCLGMLALILLVTFEFANIAYGGLGLLLFYLVIRALTVEQLFAAIKTQILLIIVGALALASALQRTGVVTYVAGALMTVAEPLGAVGIIAMVYIISVVLSMFINNSATIAILAPMVVSMSNGDRDSLKYLVWTLVLGAGSCFTTPLGYQTNLMVMPDGEYAFGDFARFGGLVQLLHGACVVLFISIMSAAS